MGNPRALALCLHALGAVRYLRGDWSASRDALERSVELARSFGGPFGEVLGEQRLAQLESAQGDLAAARERLERVLAVARRSNDPMVKAHSTGRILATLALTEFADGTLEAAARYLARGVATQKVVGECAGCDVLLYPAAVPIYLALGDIGKAEDAARKADEVAGAFRSQSWVATARYLLGLVAAEQGDGSLARERFDDALQRFEALEQPYEVARIRLALAEVAESSAQSEALRSDAADAMDHLRSG